MDFSWFFDGLGTQLLAIIIGLFTTSIVGGFAYHKITQRKKITLKQTAGNHSNQIQSEVAIINNGINEKRVKELFFELIPQALKEYTNEAHETGTYRITQLNNVLIPQIIDSNKTSQLFSDPSFQLLLSKAQQASALTDDPEKYDLLSTLILQHIKNENQPQSYINTIKAIEIINYIDNSSLCALTIAHAFSCITPESGNIHKGLERMNTLFKSILFTNLPADYEWLDYLDTFGAIRITPFGKLYSLIDSYKYRLDGYICIGINKFSPEYKQAIEKLTHNHISLSILEDNELQKNHVRISINAKKDIYKLKDENNQPISEKDKNTLLEIWNMYSTDSVLFKQVQDNFLAIWDSYPSLKQFRLWWETIPTSFVITNIGKTLAHTTAKHCDPKIPDLK